MHIPVLTKEVIGYLDPQPGENFIDGTLGAGGHTKAILAATEPEGKVLAIDLDIESLRETFTILKKDLTPKDFKRITFVHDTFSNIKEVARDSGFHPVHGILLDLGFSSDQLESRGRGLSFQRREPLDMRYDTTQSLDAQKILNYSSRLEIEAILQEYGEEQFAKEITAEILNTRNTKQISTTDQLVRIIEKATPKLYQRKKIHPATKTFQALRIATNNELEHLRHGLSRGWEVLEREGRIAVISFHSLEDRIVKQFFASQESIKILTKKPITADPKEVKLNPRARSAKLRIAVKIKPPEAS